MHGVSPKSFDLVRIVLQVRAKTFVHVGSEQAGSMRDNANLLANIELGVHSDSPRQTGDSEVPAPPVGYPASKVCNRPTRCWVTVERYCRFRCIQSSLGCGWNNIGQKCLMPCKFWPFNKHHPGELERVHLLQRAGHRLATYAMPELRLLKFHASARGGGGGGGESNLRGVNLQQSFRTRTQQHRTTSLGRPMLKPPH